MAKKDIPKNFRDILEAYESSNTMVLDINAIVDELYARVDLDDMSIGQLKRKFIKFYTTILMNQEGYRSVIRREGLFINPENCEKPEYMRNIMNNSKLSMAQKQQVLEGLKAGVAKNPTMAGQLAMDLANPGSVEQYISMGELLEMLLEDVG